MSPDAQPSKPRTLRRALLALAWLTLVAFLTVIAILASFHLPAPTGPYPVGTTILNFTDQSRPEPHNPTNRRQLVAQLWYPAAPSHNPVARYKRWREATLPTFYLALLPTNSRLDAPVASETFPIILFNHRWNGQRTQNTDLAEDLASHGYVVVSIDHPYNSTRVELPNGTVIRGTEPLEGPAGPTAPASSQIAFWNQTLETWTADSLFVLNQLAALNADPASPLHAHLDTQHAAALGHSFGGATALSLCGLDPRILACANLDGWTFGGLDHRSTQPILIEYEHVSLDRIAQLQTLPQPGSRDDQLDRADIAAVDHSLQTFGGYRLFVAGTQHLDFSDQPLLPPLRAHSYTGPIAPRLIQQIVRETILQFFDQTLHHQPAPLLTPAQQTFTELTVQTFPTHP